MPREYTPEEIVRKEKELIVLNIMKKLEYFYKSDNFNFINENWDNIANIILSVIIEYDLLEKEIQP
jgi:hypothetical protein